LAARQGGKAIDCGDEIVGKMAIVISVAEILRDPYSKKF
jgi:hypothetical protein